MINNLENENFDQIAENMIKEIDQAEEKDKNLQNQIISDSPQENISFDNVQEDIQENEDDSYKKKLAYQKKKLANLQRELGRAKEREHLLAEEALAYRNQLEMTAVKAQTSGDAAMAHYQQGINLRKEQLKEAYKKAEELNDIDSKADITTALAKLAAEEKDVESYNMLQMQRQSQQQYIDPYAYQQQYNQQYEQPYYEEQEPIEISDETQNWVKRNPWLMQNHDDHDPEKVHELLTYSQLLDMNLRKNGREDLIHSNDYYNMLDQYINNSFGNEISYQSQQQKSSHQSNQQPSRSLEQSFSGNTRSNVAPVRKSASGNYNSNKNIKFTDVDKDILSQMTRYGVTPETFAKQKLKIQEDQKIAMESGDLNAMRQYGLI